MTRKIISGVTKKGSVNPAANAISSQVFSLELIGPSAVSALALERILSEHPLGSALTRPKAFAKEPLV